MYSIALWKSDNKRENVGSDKVPHKSESFGFVSTDKLF